MKAKLGFNHTMRACNIAAFSQAIVCGFLPLLFVMFNRDYKIALYLVTLLTTLNFVMQLTMDFISLCICGCWVPCAWADCTAG